MVYFDEIKHLIKDNRKKYFRIIIEDTFFVCEGNVYIQSLDETKIVLNYIDKNMVFIGQNFKVKQSSKCQLIVQGAVEKYEIYKN